MAASATIYHLQIELSDVDRGVYQTLDLRLARHPSETMAHLLTRVLAYCLCYEEGIVFSKGLSTADEPAAWVKDPHGRINLWIDVGMPAAERLHKASKASERVVVFTHRDPALLKKVARGQTIHRVETIDVRAVDPDLLTAMEAATDRTSKWVVVHTEGMLYVTIGDLALSGAVTQHSLVEEPTPL
jgi:uncharacterized protein YaeQ